MEEPVLASEAADDSGERSGDSNGLRGFRKRWGSSEYRSPEQLSIDSSPGQKLPDLNSEQFLQELDDQFGDIGEWSMAGESVEYAPSSQGEPAWETEGKVTVTGNSEQEYSWKLQALQSATKRARLYSEKFPWESSNLNGVFGPADPFSHTIVSGYKHMLSPAHDGIYDVLQSELSSGSHSIPVAEASSPPVRRIVLLGARRETPDEDIRRVALLKLRDLIMGDPSATQLGVSLQHLLSEGNMSHVIEQSFHDCFRSKASSTLQKRANSLWKLSLLLAELGVLHPLRFSEEELYNALCLMREKGMGATSGQHVIEALHFLDGTAGLALCNIGDIISGRCRGVARDMHLSKDPLSQKHPLSVEQVEWLEQLIQDAPGFQQCIIGQLLFCLHSCCRWRDSQRLKRAYVEHAKGECLLHADAISSKTSLTVDSKTRFLPYVAIGTGLLGEDWASTWLRSRSADAMIGGDFFLPSYSERCQCWIDQPMSASEATGWLREFLLRNEPSLELGKYGSHSCKCTLLTWAGRSTTVVFTPTERRLLGHHVEPSLRSMLIYSRESYTALYAKVMKLFTLIRSREFRPDLPAIDRVMQYVEGGASEVPMTTSAFAETAEPVNGTMAAQGDILIEDSDSSEGSDTELNCLTMQKRATADMSEDPSFPGVPISAFRIHCRSGLRHVMNEDSFLICGRQMSSNFKGMDEVASSSHIENCSQCLKIFGRQTLASQDPFE